MREVLIILTQPCDSLAEVVAASERRLPNHKIKTVELSAAEPDYHALLEDIFRAEAVQVW